MSILESESHFLIWALGATTDRDGDLLRANHLVPNAMLIIDCICTFESLEKMVPKSLVSVSLTTVRRHDRKCFEYMEVYRKILTRKAAKYAAEMYRSYREVANTISRNVDVLLLPIIALCNGSGKTRWILMDFDNYLRRVIVDREHRPATQCRLG